MARIARPRPRTTPRVATLGIRMSSGQPNFAEFKRLAGQANVVPVYRASAPYRSAALPGLPPFTVGAVGYLSYETVRQLERLPARVPPDVEMDDAVFLYFANLAAFDHVQHRLFLISNVLTEEGSGSLQAKYHAALRELDRMERRLSRPLGLPRFRHPRGPLRVRSTMTRERYEHIVARGKEYIRAG